MFFNWKKQLEKVQLKRDLKDDTLIYRGIPLFCIMTKDTAIPLHETSFFCLVPRRHMYYI